MAAAAEAPPDNRDAYLTLLKRCLLDDVYGGQRVVAGGKVSRAAKPEEISEGKYWPERAHSMIGHRRMDNVRECVETCLREGVPGDLMETGVWRGGATIFMRGILRAWGDTERRVLVADSFEGLPPPEAERYPADAGDGHHKVDFLAVSQEQVAANFERYGLLDERVVFIKGFFEHSLPGAPVDRLAVLRLDGDMYSSTIQVLDTMYDKVVPGGFVIVDDYALAGCRKAVDDFRARRGIAAPMTKVDWTGMFWRKSAAATPKAGPAGRAAVPLALPSTQTGQQTRS
jgi:hypothetical protein